MPIRSQFQTEQEWLEHLRLYFAAKAMQAYLQNVATGAELERKFDKQGEVANATGDESPFDYIARLSLHMADAMLKARAAK